MEVVTWQQELANLDYGCTATTPVTDGPGYEYVNSSQASQVVEKPKALPAKTRGKSHHQSEDNVVMLRSETYAGLEDESQEEEEKQRSEEGFRDNMVMLRSESYAALEDESKEEEEEQRSGEGLRDNVAILRRESYADLEDESQKEDEEEHEPEERLWDNVALPGSESYAPHEDEVKQAEEKQEPEERPRDNLALPSSESYAPHEDEVKLEEEEQEPEEGSRDNVVMPQTESQAAFEDEMKQEEKDEQQSEEGLTDLLRGTAFAGPQLESGVLNRGGEVYVRRRCGACLLKRSRGKCSLAAEKGQLSIEPDEPREVEKKKKKEEWTPWLEKGHPDCKQHWSVLPFDLLPDWRKDNHFLHHGHRPSLPTISSCFLSIFRLHTETFNIWTHLIGFLLFLCWGVVYMFKSNLDFVAPLQEKMVIGMFFLGAILCTCFSWVYHTVHCHSREMALTFSKLDYTGIALLFLGSIVPWIYYTFYCSPVARYVYLLIFTILGISSIILSHQDWFSTTPYRVVRAGVFLGMGLGAFIPFFHFMIFTEGSIEEALRKQQSNFLTVAFLYLLGVTLYIFRIPERFCPGRCQIWFHSHQMFHVLVVAAAIVHLCAISQMQEFRFFSGGACK